MGMRSQSWILSHRDPLVSEIIAQPCGVCYDTGNDIEWEFRWSNDIMSAVRDSIYMVSKTTR